MVPEGALHPGELCLGTVLRGFNPVSIHHLCHSKLYEFDWARDVTSPDMSLVIMMRASITCGPGIILSLLLAPIGVDKRFGCG